MKLFEITEIKETINTQVLADLKTAIIQAAPQRNSTPRARVGSAQDVGRLSSSRPAGQNGTIRPGDETNALDAMSDDF